LRSQGGLFAGLDASIFISKAEIVEKQHQQPSDQKRNVFHDIKI
jgi:hypothetical protein